MIANINQDINVPCWGTTDPNDLADTIGTMFLPLKSANAVISERIGGFFPDDHVGHWDLHFFASPVPNPYPDGADSMSQGILAIADLYGYFNPADAWWWPDHDFHLIGTFTMHTSSNPDLLGNIVCPFAEGFDPANGHATYGFNHNLEPIDPITTYSCLAFGCFYTAGDINSNGTVNGIDIVYAVNYLKGGLHPSAECFPFCPLTPDPFYPAGDVNGNCAFNGVDITFFMRFLKLQVPELLYCPDCPPAN